MDADDADLTMIMQDDDGDNVVFESVQAASEWLENNARAGWCTLIVELDADDKSIPTLAAIKETP